MGVYFAGSSRSAEDQIWDHIDRMRDAGPVADYYLAAHERRVWALGTGRSATSGTGISAVTAAACRRWIGTRLVAVSRWIQVTAPVQVVDNDRFRSAQRRMAS
jgi:hypothetical protein